MPDFDLRPEEACFLLIDVQEKFLGPIPSIAPDQPVGRMLGILLAGIQAFPLPIIACEQYPKGLGPTLPHLVNLLGTTPRLAKTAFSPLDDAPTLNALADLGRRQVIVAGIEAHACVLAGVTDLQRRGYQAIVAADAIASRNPEHAALAVMAMQQLGALCLPTESILLRLQRNAVGERFKKISALIR